ncbi:MAG: division/cell wall cluster transcriptional repressor MraZ, partial [Solirubrobacteraceae bacterium]
PATPKARKLQRLYFGFSEQTELDAAYRVMIPTTLMAYAGLDREVTITGLGHCLEIWDRARFRDSFDAIITEGPQLNASLGDTT